MGRWIAAALASLVAAFLVLGVEWVESDAPGDSGAAEALAAVTSASFDPHHPAAAFPHDWRAVMGYLPAVATGPRGTPILIKPTGDCSSPLGSTEYHFDPVCKEHDLAYDVLRYSARIGAPLPASARRAADNMFGRELHATCDAEQLVGPSSGVCHVLAESFADVVRVNSWRQGYHPPDRESLSALTPMLLLALGLMSLREVHGALRRRALRVSGPAAGLLPPPRPRHLVDRLLPGIPEPSEPAGARIPAVRPRQRVAA